MVKVNERIEEMMVKSKRDRREVSMNDEYRG